MAKTSAVARDEKRKKMITKYAESVLSSKSLVTLMVCKSFLVTVLQLVGRTATPFTDAHTDTCAALA